MDNTLFMPDVGSARADFPGGDARQLYRSMRRLLELPPATVMYVCHDYPRPAARRNGKPRLPRNARITSTRAMASARMNSRQCARVAEHSDRYLSVAG